MDCQVPPAVHRRPGGAEPPGGFLRGQPLGEGEEAVGDVHLVAVEDPGVNAALDPPSAMNSTSHRAPGSEMSIMTESGLVWSSL